MCMRYVGTFIYFEQPLCNSFMQFAVNCQVLLTKIESEIVMIVEYILFMYLCCGDWFCLQCACWHSSCNTI